MAKRTERMTESERKQFSSDLDNLLQKHGLTGCFALVVDNDQKNHFCVGIRTGEDPGLREFAMFSLDWINAKGHLRAIQAFDEKGNRTVNIQNPDNPSNN